MSELIEAAREDVERIPWFDESSDDDVWQGEIQQEKYKRFLSLVTKYNITRRDRTKKFPMTSERFRQLFCIKVNLSLDYFDVKF